VITGAPVLPPEPLDDAPDDPLARVETAPGALGPAPAPACEPLAPVRAALPAPGAAEAAWWEPGNLAPGSCRITWIVRRMTWVRTSAAGLRAATAVGVLALEGLSV
jgi:hypothetical protein